MELLKQCQPICQSILQAVEDNHVDLEWGVTQGQEMLRIGWGCPLHAPIQGITGGMGWEMLGYINYFLPLAEFSTILTGWVMAIGAYYVASTVLRWIKAIS